VRLAITLPPGTDFALAERTLLSVAGADAEADGGVQIDLNSHQMTVPFSAGVRGIAEAMNRFDNAGLEVTDLSLRRPTLDDVFLQLTGHVAESGADATTENAA
jgi:ABC-2 type transport system ATP-binding protein